MLGTDISRRALERAGRRVYRRWSLRGLDDTVVQRYFRQIGHRWELDARLERRVTFRFHNLAQPASLPALDGSSDMDLILCRNVLIFDKYVRIARSYTDGAAFGRGLGLAFCRIAVQAHGGRIWVEDNQPRGSVFVVNIRIDQG